MTPPVSGESPDVVEVLAGPSKGHRLLDMGSAGVRCTGCDWTWHRSDTGWFHHAEHVAAEQSAALREAGWVVVRAEGGLALVGAERTRQIEVEGRTPAHDRDHVDESLALAACCYAIPGTYRRYNFAQGDTSSVPTIWPWSSSDWKPTPGDRVRELVKAGALIAAEIDRLTALDGAS